MARTFLPGQNSVGAKAKIAWSLGGDVPPKVSIRDTIPKQYRVLCSLKLTPTPATSTAPTSTHTVVAANPLSRSHSPSQAVRCGAVGRRRSQGLPALRPALQGAVGALHLRRLRRHRPNHRRRPRPRMRPKVEEAASPPSTLPSPLGVTAVKLRGVHMRRPHPEATPPRAEQAAAPGGQHRRQPSVGGDRRVRGSGGSGGRRRRGCVSSEFPALLRDRVTYRYFGRDTVSSHTLLLLLLPSFGFAL